MIPILIVAFNRPKSLLRLLASLEQAQYPATEQVKLIISFDGNSSLECIQIAEAFRWNFGDKEIIQRSNHLGLKQHIIECGRLSQAFGSVIVLEDDLIVSPAFYAYASEAVEFYSPDERIASIALYSYQINEFCNYPFETIDDGWNTFFMKVPCSWGQVFIGARWTEFEALIKETGETIDGVALPKAVLHQWSPFSWKKLFFKYLVLKNKFVVYPNFSYSDHFGDNGTNFKNDPAYLSTGLSTNAGPFRFPVLGDTCNVYDSFMELDSEYLDQRTDDWSDCEMDIYGIKPLNIISKPLLLTSREVRQEVRNIPASLSPIQANVMSTIGRIADSNCHLKIAKIEDVIQHKTNPTLDLYYGMRVSPKLAAYYKKMGSDIQRAYFLNRPMIKWGMFIKKFLRLLLPKKPNREL